MDNPDTAAADDQAAKPATAHTQDADTAACPPNGWAEPKSDPWSEWPRDTGLTRIGPSDV